MKKNTWEWKMLTVWFVIVCPAVTVGTLLSLSLWPAANDASLSLRISVAVAVICVFGYGLVHLIGKNILDDLRSSRRGKTVLIVEVLFMGVLLSVAAGGVALMGTVILESPQRQITQQERDRRFVMSDSCYSLELAGAVRARSERIKKEGKDISEYEHFYDELEVLRQKWCVPQP